MHRSFLILLPLAAAPLFAAGEPRVESTFGSPRFAVVDPADDCIIPQVITNGPWQTSILLVNMGATEARIKIFFASDSGEDLPFPWGKIGTYNALVVSVPGRGSFTLESVRDPAAPIIEGWGLIMQNGLADTYGKVAAMAIVRHGDREMVVPVSTAAEKRSLLLFDNTGTANTLASAINFEITPVSLQFRAFDSDGRILVDERFEIPALGRRVIDLSSIGALQGRKGSADFITSGKYMPVVGIRLDTGGGLSSVPAFSLRNWRED